jgi:membrane-associated protein
MDEPRPLGRGGRAARARWRPWPGRPQVADLVCFAGLVASGVYQFAMIPLTPMLIAIHPVLLEVLSGSTLSIVVAGAVTVIDRALPLWLVIVAALPGLMMFDPLYWWAGARWGRRAVNWLTRRSRRAGALAGWVGRREARFTGPLVMLAAFLPGIPAPLVYAAAGWAGLRLAWFLIWDAAGSLAWAALLAWLGYQLGPDGVAVANLVSRYALISMAALAVIAAAPRAWRVLSARRGIPRRPGGASGRRPGEASPIQEVSHGAATGAGDSAGGR